MNENFKNWFHDSQVVNAAGEPLVVYHGTWTNFTEFQGDVHYFAEDVHTAKDFGDVVIEAYVSIKNPLRFDYKDGSPMSREEAIAAGHDGFVIDNYDVGEGDSISQNEGAVWAAFFPGQIKAAYDNSGAYDPANPDITDRRIVAAQDALAYLESAGKKATPHA